MLDRSPGGGHRQALQLSLLQLAHELTIAAQMACGPDPEAASPVLRDVLVELGKLVASLPT